MEIKNPYERKLLNLNVDNIQFDQNWYQMKILLREVMISGDSHKYLAITNLSLKFSKILDAQIYYWHQCQLQSEVLKVGDYIDYVQHGTFPNPNYLNNDLLLITQVPANTMWISNYGYKLRQTWDEIQYYKDLSHSLPTEVTKSKKFQYPSFPDKKRKFELFQSFEEECPL